MSAAFSSHVNTFVFAYPGDLQTVSGGYIYDRYVIKELRTQGWEIELLSLGPGFPFPDHETLNKAGHLLSQIQPSKPIVVDGLALGVMPEAIARASVNHPIIALIHHPLAYESGLTADQQVKLKGSERLALSYADHVIANSPLTAQSLMETFGVDERKITIVIPGANQVFPPLHQVRNHYTSQNEFKWLSVGSIIPRKGFDILIKALAPLNDMPWSLSIVGDNTRDVKAYSDLLGSITYFHLQDRVHICGVIDNMRLDSLYREADGFVLASLFEGYGMAYAEALSYALPIVGANGGAISQTVPDSAGILTPPGDVTSLTSALKLVMRDSHLREQLSLGAKEAAKKLPTWIESAKVFADVIKTFGAN